MTPRGPFATFLFDQKGPLKFLFPLVPLIVTWQTLNNRKIGDRMKFDLDLAVDIDSYRRDLDGYLYANKLLLACLESESYVSKKTRLRIAAEILSPSIKKGSKS